MAKHLAKVDQKFLFSLAYFFLSSFVDGFSTFHPVLPVENLGFRLYATELDSNPKDEKGLQNPTYYSPNVPLRDGFASEVNGDEALDSASSFNEYSFFDEARIYVRAGSGGQGAATYKKLGPTGTNGPPDGGNGGNGGSVILEVDPSLNTLAGLTHAWRPNSFGGSGAAAAASASTPLRPKSFRAENGGDGDRQFKNGRFGKDVTIRVPPGTVVHEIILDENGDVVEKFELGSLVISNDSNGYDNNVSNSHGVSRLVVAQGGEGGEGTGVKGKNRGVHRPRVPPTGGERKTLELTLKIVADVALVAVPNAGKSTLLAAVTRAKPKIANYPFTTIIPNLGVWIPPINDDQSHGSNSYSKGAGSDGLVLCDVPGLIAGAARGVGLGHAFLRHVERCHVIVHIVDATSDDPVADYLMLNEEILKYGTDGKLASMPQVVVVNKVDAFEGVATEEWEKGLQVKWSRQELERKLKEVMPHSRLMWMSAKNKEGVDDLMTRLAAFVKKVKDAQEIQRT